MTHWERRIARAQALEKEVPAAAELLRFYREIARFQESIADTGPAGRPGHEQALRALVRKIAPKGQANWGGTEQGERFIALVLEQAYSEPSVLTPESDRATCPVCNELPLVAILRPEGEGGRRSLGCSRCFSEWTFRRLVCPNCGNEDQEKLPVYTAEPFPHVRVEACDICQTYLKCIDMTRNGLAVPEVDELASAPLDLWAGENGYRKLQPNLLGL